MRIKFMLSCLAPIALPLREDQDYQNPDQAKEAHERFDKWRAFLNFLTSLENEICSLDCTPIVGDCLDLRSILNEADQDSIDDQFEYFDKIITWDEDTTVTSRDLAKDENGFYYKIYFDAPVYSI